MANTTDELKTEIQKSLSLMQTLRDEVRLKMHLAGMEAKEEWHKLDPYLVEVEQAACHFTDATHTMVTEAIKRLSKLRASIS